MPFWAYMLHCRGGSFYVGHTDDLERRIAEHQSGLIPGFTAERLPVELVWSEAFQTRDDAKVAEHKLKGWSRAKKLALIRGDWERISTLAKKKDGASTSSARTEGEGNDAGEGGDEAGEGKNHFQETVGPELVEGPSSSLRPHPAHPPLSVTAVQARILAADGPWLRLRWRIEGAARLVVPPFAGKGRADGLWRTTCFELFLRAGPDESYVELNFSPSERWAAYDFAAYREGMAERAIPGEPDCTMRLGQGLAIFDASVPAAGLPPLPWQAGLTAVLEEEGGRLSYWALAHPPGKPDFHDPACFALHVPAPEGA